MLTEVMNMWACTSIPPLSCRRQYAGYHTIILVTVCTVRGSGSGWDTAVVFLWGSDEPLVG